MCVQVDMCVCEDVCVCRCVCVCVYVCNVCVRVHVIDTVLHCPT